MISVRYKALNDDLSSNFDERSSLRASVPSQMADLDLLGKKVYGYKTKINQTLHLYRK